MQNYKRTSWANSKITHSLRPWDKGAKKYISIVEEITGYSGKLVKVRHHKMQDGSRKVTVEVEI